MVSHQKVTLLIEDFSCTFEISGFEKSRIALCAPLTFGFRDPPYDGAFCLLLLLTTFTITKLFNSFISDKAFHHSPTKLLTTPIKLFDSLFPTKLSHHPSSPTSYSYLPILEF